MSKTEIIILVLVFIIIAGAMGFSIYAVFG